MKFLYLALALATLIPALPARAAHPTVVSVEASGNWYTHALMSDGTAYSWGNYYGTFPSSVQACLNSTGAFDFTRFAPCEERAVLTGIKSIKPGQNHQLVLLEAGTPADTSDDFVVAWGLSSRGQLGDGYAGSYQSTPVRVVCGEMAGTPFCTPDGFLQGVIAVAASGGQGGSSGSSLALLADRTLVAWGWNNFGQLGNGVSGQQIQSTPVRVRCGAVKGRNCAHGYLAGVEAIEPGIASNYALLPGGKIVVWGFNAFGWLGDGTTEASPTPVYVVCGDFVGTQFCSREGYLQGVQALSKDQTSPHFLALLSDGRVAAWGLNAAGRLGDGTTTQRLAPVSVVCGEMVGTSFCSPEGHLQGVVAVASGTVASLALLSDGRVVTWGPAGSGQLGNGTTIDALVPVLVPELSGVVDISAGYDHDHAVLADGSLYSWGQNNVAQLAYPSSAGITTPSYIRNVGGAPGSRLADVTAFAANYPGTVALKSDGTVLAWGQNPVGQLGDGTTIGSTVPVQVTGLGPGSGVTDIASNGSSSFALKSDGTVLAWGGNSSGELGDGTTTDRYSPVQVIGLGPGSGVVDVDESLAVKSDGTVLAWGRNDVGQLGNGTTVDSTVPVQVSGLGSGSGAVAVASGASTRFAIIDSGSTLGDPSDDTVLAWGFNGNGQLGDGTTSQRTTPVSVQCGAMAGTQFCSPSGELQGVVSIHGRGNTLTVALLSDGTMLQWGGGQTTPVPIPVVSGITAFDAGSGHVLALRADGRLLAWGGNGFGQLGDGTTTGSGTPVTVQGCYDASGELIPTPSNSSCADVGGTLSDLTGVAVVGAGYEHSLAVLSDGTALSWGDQTGGFLGNGSEGPISTVPVLTLLPLDHEVADLLAGAGLDYASLPAPVRSELLHAAAAGALRTTGTVNSDLSLSPGAALVVESGATVDGAIRGDGSGVLVLGTAATVTGSVDEVGHAVYGENAYVGGSHDSLSGGATIAGGGVSIAGEVETRDLELLRGAGLTVGGNVEYGGILKLAAGSTLDVGANLECGSGATAEIGISATLTVHGNNECSAAGGH